MVGLGSEDHSEAETGKQHRIEDHKAVYDHPNINLVLRNAGFKDADITCGYFECFMNLWTIARKMDSDV